MIGAAGWGVAALLVIGSGWLYRRERAARVQLAYLRRALAEARDDDALARERLADEGRALEQARAALDVATRSAGASARAKATFLSNMSHELRTPLNAIIGYAELLREDLDGDAAEDVRRILHAGRRLLAFVTDVLELSRMESGAVQPAPTPTDLAEVVEQVTERNRRHIEAAGNRLLLVGTRSAAPDFFTDPQLIAEILEALLDNAARYLRDSVVRVELEHGRRGDLRWCRIHVHDDGEGVPEDRVDGLFEPFADTNVSADPRAGFGLGLPRAARYARLIDGALYVDSAPGQGATFTVELFELRRDARAAVDDGGELDSLVTRAQGAERSPEAMVSALVAQSSTPRAPVLLVEDDDDTRRLLTAALRNAGLRVEAVDSGARALEALTRQRFAVMLLDLMMPGVDGFAVLDAVRRDPTLASMPVLICTAMDLDERARRRLVGSAAVLRKHDLHDPVHIVRGVQAQLGG